MLGSLNVSAKPEAGSILTIPVTLGARVGDSAGLAIQTEVSRRNHARRRSVD